MHGSGLLFGDEGSLESVTGVAGPVLLAATVPDLSRGDVLAGRYQIEAVIGSGGSGRVLRAFDRVTRSPVALKILRSEFAADPVWTERFSRELRVGRQIQHPNVCRVYDIGEADGHRFLSMELATGGTLRTQLEPGSMPRSVDDRIADARAIIQGVAALHAAGIVHRDLKPENILRTADGRLLVSDFGLATDPGSGPATTVMIGTPRYMAPEVVMGDPATTRSDVWALGVVMHEILSGERPDRSLIKRKRRIYTPPEVGSIRERRLVELCARCSEEDPDERPASAVELRREFEAAAAGRRFGNRSLKKQVAWGAVALATIASLGLIRNRWTSNAVASSSQSAGSYVTQILQPVGSPRDWNKASKTLATFDGAVHCLSTNAQGDRGRIVWGEPRRAEEIELKTGARSEWKLAREAFEVGCPEVSPDGRSLLFEKDIEGARQILFSEAPSGHDPKILVRGTRPKWLPNSQEFSFILDSRHAGTFSVPTREMTLLPDSISAPHSVDEQAVDTSGRRLAVLYTTESFGSLLVVHALPGLEVVGSSRVPDWARHLRFGRDGDVQFTVMGPNGLRQLVSTDVHVSVLRTLANAPGFDIQNSLDVAGSPIWVSRVQTFDLWRRDTKGSLSPVTVDGQSVNGAQFVDGRIVVQRALPSGEEVIVVRNAQGQDAQITEGPRDLTPFFFPDGKRFAYAKVDSSEIVECGIESRRCTTIAFDKFVPAYPAISPSGQQVAYLTSLNASRIKIVSLGTTRKKERDLGPAQACGPLWASDRHLWVVTSVTPDRKTWAEIDVESGARTGRVRPVEVKTGGDACPPPGGDASAGPVARLVSLARQKSYLGRLENDPR